MELSIIIPAYNEAERIGKTLKSFDWFLRQKSWHYEMLVVDDGSTDNTHDILNSYQNNFLVLRQNNKGVSSARNRGLAAASGHFIAFLDSDDIWLPQKLSQQVDFFHSNPDALICQTEEIWIRNNVRVNPKKRHKKPSGMIFEPSLSLCLVSPSAVMIKRSLFEEVGLFDETLPACEDYDLWLRVSCRHPVHLIDTPLIIKRGGHDDQLSASHGLDKFRIKAIKKVIESGLLSAAQYQTAVETLKEKCDIYASGCRKRGRMDEAAYYEALAKRYNLTT